MRVPTINVLSKHIKIIKKFQTKFSIFNAEKFLCVLHGQVFIMPIGNSIHRFSYDMENTTIFFSGRVCNTFIRMIHNNDLVFKMQKKLFALIKYLQSEPS